MAERIRKNMDMDASKLAAAQAILGARTETETVDLALDCVVQQGEVLAALDRLVEAGGLDDPYLSYTAKPAPRRVAERRR